MFIGTLPTTICLTHAYGVILFPLPIFSFIEVKNESFNTSLAKRSGNSHMDFIDKSGYINVSKHPSIYERNETEYDYDNLLQEYYEDDVNETYVATEKKGLLIKYIRKIILLDGPTKIHSETIDKVGKTKTGVPMATWRYLSKVIKIWFLIYFIIALPLWCIKGWCCCCLLCHIFKPQQTIDEAKTYLVTNPPGVFKIRNDVIYYDPTDYEKEAYEKFEHMLRTI